MKLALRRLRSRPGYTGLIVVIVAVGIGAATTVFSVHWMPEIIRESSKNMSKRSR